MSRENQSNLCTLQSYFQKPIFFYCCDNHFSHLSICLAEGLKELNIPFYSNINFWQTSPDAPEYLFCYNPEVTPDDCSVVVLDIAWLSSISYLLEKLFHPKRTYITVYLDFMDGFTIWNPELNNFDLRFRTHYNSKYQYPSNCVPWVFGISNRILQETTDFDKFQVRKMRLLANFRVSQAVLEISHSWLKIDGALLKVDSGTIIVENPLRQIIREQFFPRIQEILPVDDTVDNFDRPPSDSYHRLQWQQTDKRHYPNYYQRLKESVACACFAGCITSGNLISEPIVEWWDSWRFWESLAAGCATFHVDFDKYGIQLPVMPENWRHYIGIDLDNIQDTIDRITNEPQILERVSLEGRQWARENYRPVSTALRFLEIISDRSSSCEPHADSLATFSLPIHLREINLIIFPDWSVSEESVAGELEQVIKAFISSPNNSRMTLLIVASSISEDDVNLILSGVIMNLLMQNNFDTIEEPAIAAIGQLTKVQWLELMTNLKARIALKNENRQLIIQCGAIDLPVVELDSTDSW